MLGVFEAEQRTEVKCERKSYKKAENPICSGEDCNRVSLAKGLCSFHYHQKRRKAFKLSECRIPRQISEESAQHRGRNAEHAVAALLMRMGRKAEFQHYNAPFDLLVDGTTKIDVKVAPPAASRKDLCWSFNIHKHGVLNECADFYLLRLEGVPFSRAAIHLLVPSPIGVKTFVVSFRSLLSRHAVYSQAFLDFAKITLDT